MKAEKLSQVAVGGINRSSFAMLKSDSYFTRYQYVRRKLRAERSRSVHLVSDIETDERGVR